MLKRQKGADGLGWRCSASWQVCVADFQGEAGSGAAALRGEGGPPSLVPTSPGPSSPAAVVPLCVQRRLGSAEAQAGERMVQGQHHVAQAVDAVRLIVDVLPVGAQARGARRVVPVQVIVQLPDDFLIHHRFELAGKEGGPGCLLCSGEKKSRVSTWRWQGGWGVYRPNSAARLLGSRFRL